MNYQNAGPKEQYRITLYDFVDKQIPDIPRRKRRVLYLDTADACETRFLLQRGYHSENLYATNFSAAQLAHIRMKIKKEFGKEQAVKLPLKTGDILKRAVLLDQQGIQVNMYNFDFCRNFNLNNLQHWTNEWRKIKNENFCISITLAKGREHRKHFEHIEYMHNCLKKYRMKHIKDPFLKYLEWEDHICRSLIFLKIIHGRYHDMKNDTGRHVVFYDVLDYVSHSQPMQVMMAKIRKQLCTTVVEMLNPTTAKDFGSIYKKTGQITKDNRHPFFQLCTTWQLAFRNQGIHFDLANHII